MMQLISRQVEQQILKYQMPIDFYAGFQRLSYFPAQSERYERLGAVCRSVSIFSVIDREIPVIPGVDFVPLAEDSALVQEWFLLVDAPEFWTLLNTQEMTPHDDGTRQFQGLWTFDLTVVEEASAMLADVLDRPYTPHAERHHTLQAQNIHEVTDRLLKRLEANQMPATQPLINHTSC